MQSEEGQCLAAARPADATVLLELSPTALLFGAWHSQGVGGGLGAKFPRALVSESWASHTGRGWPPPSGTGEVEAQTAGRHTGSRIDPLGILRKVEVFRGASISIGIRTRTRPAKAPSGPPLRDKPQQHRTRRRAAGCHLRPRGTSGDYHTGGTEETAFRRRRTRRYGAHADRGARPAGIGRAGCARLRLALALRSGLRGVAPLELVHANGSTKSSNSTVQRRERCTGTLTRKLRRRASSFGR